jgi:hypothetical protein
MSTLPNTVIRWVTRGTIRCAGLAADLARMRRETK